MPSIAQTYSTPTILSTYVLAGLAAGLIHPLLRLASAGAGLDEFFANSAVALFLIPAIVITLAAVRPLIAFSTIGVVCCTLAAILTESLMERIIPIRIQSAAAAATTVVPVRFTSFTAATLFAWPLYIGLNLMTIWIAAPFRVRYRDHALLCRDCQYPLAGLAERRCPECGRPFDLDQSLNPHPPSPDQ